ncbi:heavy metal-binding domain-containing protein [Methylopila sp. 73B]|uniref:YbjQ family protein n=1 Tax=Methylopila sp. 73B TaxID=1120792 RepID=UPI0003661689|nr:heavy metal-binding domain-containing protein [Methylopila sp. 73B]
MQAAAEAIVVTTGPALPGAADYEILDVISAEAAMAMNIFKDIATAWRDTFGGRAKSLQGALREARVLCLSELRVEALKLGADAVIAVDLDYSEFNSANASGSMLFVVATGTAVRFVR